jgi:hypothetical protein
MHTQSRWEDSTLRTKRHASTKYMVWVVTSHDSQCCTKLGFQLKLFAILWDLGAIVSLSEGLQAITPSLGISHILSRKSYLPMQQQWFPKWHAWEALLSWSTCDMFFSELLFLQGIQRLEHWLHGITLTCSTQPPIYKWMSSLFLQPTKVALLLYPACFQPTRLCNFASC